MLKVNKLTDYATVILSYMASKPTHTYSALDITSAVNINQPTVSKVLKHLTQEGLVISHRGVSGGYHLASDPKVISVAQVIRAMEGQLGMTECSIEPGLCELESTCALRTNWQKISNAVLIALESVSIADMQQPMVQPKFNLDVLKQTPIDTQNTSRVTGDAT